MYLPGIYERTQVLISTAHGITRRITEGRMNHALR
jgi:hypothetical protein